MESSLVPGGTPTVVAAVAEVPAAGKSKSVTCGYCECVLAGDGGVLRTSERVKALNRQDEKIDNLKAEIARLETEVSQLTADNAALKATLQQAASSRRSLDWE